MVTLESIGNLETIRCFAGAEIASVNSLQCNSNCLCVEITHADLAVPYNPALSSLVSKAICMMAFKDPLPEHAQRQCAKTRLANAAKPAGNHCYCI